jgi:hypothetical protein
MLRYDLDALGWYQFEWLVQSLLKEDIGLTIESWGGRRDFGRDAYCDSELHFPEKQFLSEGPFVFQVKFVEGANRSGAQPFPSLRIAVVKESTHINKRISSNDWETPAHYVLLTNAVVDGAERTTIKQLLLKSLPGVSIHLFCGNDLCDRLDLLPELRRAFPQILSLRDLNVLFRDAVNGGLLKRSDTLATSAKRLLPVFVPTVVYEKAWSVLRKHHFVVLEGPPEMGKTAIADTIATAQLSMNWQALVCQDPDAFFSLFEKRPQVFVADDAFGRTEYDPTRGRKWEADLDRVLGMLDNNHWLIWTSRKHILERALHKLDLQGKASHFPRPGDVLVDSSKLTQDEKALILYRDAKAANLSTTGRQLIKSRARQIVAHQSFTPERIRRFVTERLSDFLARYANPNAEELITEINNEIQNPTDRMVKTFRALPNQHKFLLIALLESDGPCTPRELKKLYGERYPDESGETLDEVMEELSEAFISIRKDL